MKGKNQIIEVWKMEENNNKKTKKHRDPARLAIKITALCVAIIMVLAVGTTLVYYLVA